MIGDGEGKMDKVAGMPGCMQAVMTHYCGGCGHGLIHRLIGEVIDELGVRERAVGIAPVGCAVIAYEYFNFDFVEVAHGRAPAVATGIKRVSPETVVFSYQGDGDLAAIGTAEIIHAANRGEKITTVFVNNAVYGMTGGQMAPTTLEGQRTATSPRGRNVAESGYPLRVAELLAVLRGTVFSCRVAVNSSAGIRKTKKALRRAFDYQLEGRGFSVVEILSPCPSYWRMKPAEAKAWIGEVMVKEFPLGTFKEEGGGPG